MQQNCVHCSQAFEISDVDLAFYEKISPVFSGKKEFIPLPTHCPDCRQQRRLCFHNENSLYYRKCNLTGKQIISNYSANAPYIVYNQKDWTEENGWSALDYGREFDFNRPFFEQFKELHHAIPHPSLITDYHMNQNSDFTNYTGSCKNCYLIFHADFNEECLYGYGIKKCLKCVDCSNVLECELCYECVDCTKCYNLQYSKDCYNCSDSFFLDDCIGCKHCLGCSGLRNKEYCINNKEYTKAEYEQYVGQCNLTSAASINRLKELATKYRLETPKKTVHSTNCIECTGDYLIDCKHSIECYDSNQLEDCRHCYQVLMGAKNCADIYQFGINIEHCYECSMLGYNCQSIYFSSDVSNQCHNILYSIACRNGSHHLFGCSGMMRKEYCILNKQYSKEEYEDLIPKIIKHMKKTGEWGQPFPIDISINYYNETRAMEYFPMTEKQVKEKNWQWKEDELEQSHMGPVYDVSDSINDVDDSICQAVLMCQETKKPYKIISQELDFYRSQQIPIPKLCPQARRANRMNTRNKRKLWDRLCERCNKQMFSSFSPDDPERVYCEECYRNAVY